MRKNTLLATFLPLFTIAGLIYCTRAPGNNTMPVKPDADNAGLKLPDGFGALIAASNTGRARHLAVTAQGDIYVKLNKLNDGKGIVYLHDSNGDGKMDDTKSFGNYAGTGMYVKDGYLYASSNTEIFRYKLNTQGQVINEASPERIVTGLLNRRQHESKSITLDNAGNIYVNVGAYSNSCQERDRQPGSMGRKGCPILDSAGGIWQFRADKADQTYGTSARYATGLRNVVGLDWNTQNNQLYVMQHGRDQLHDLFPSLYTEKQSAVLPAECLYALQKGDNAGWPYIYYDQLQHKKMQAPEYGGDGKKESTGNYIDPAAAYPGHMAPNGLLFYTGTMFPEKYRNGAFIAFHGSWNRAPEPQAGYFVVFQPFKNGKPFGQWEVFADGFSGSAQNTASGNAEHRPCGLAQGPDGSLYVSDDSKGTIYRIIYNGQATAQKAQPVKATKPQSNTSGATKTSGKTAVSAKSDQRKSATLLGGKAIYAKYCLSCHQANGQGVANMNPPLIKTQYVLGNKTRLIKIVLNGFSERVEINGDTYTNVMPSFSNLSNQQVADVLTYVRNNFTNKASAVTAAEVAKVRAAVKK